MLVKMQSLGGKMGKETLGTIGIMAGVPFVHSEFAWSLAQMIQFNNEYVCTPGQIVHMVKSDMSFHAAARNQLVAQMMGEWMLMLDCDHAFGPDLLSRMLSVMYTHDVDVLSAVYHYRAAPYFPSLFMWTEDGKGFRHVSNWDATAKIMEVDGTGAGTLLVRRSVFDRIREELEEEPFSITVKGLGEDFNFYHRLKRLGIKAYFCPYIQSGHLMTKPLTSEDYQDRMPELSVDIEVGGVR